MTIIVNNIKKAEWDSYVINTNASVFSHYFDWGESLAATYGLPLFRLAAISVKEERRITGILPLMLFAAPGRDVRLISLPYSDASGVVADDEETGHKLVGAALDLAEKLGAAHVELRQAGNAAFTLPVYDEYLLWSHAAHTFKTGLLRALPESADELWAILPAKVRNQVRKARKSGCSVQRGAGRLLADFYTVFSENMRDLGSPVHASELFQALSAQDSLQSEVLVVYLDDQPVAAAMVFLHNEILCNPWASSLRRFRPSGPNMLLYWSMLEFAVTSGCRWFDFGRSSPDASTCRFKCQWGATRQPLIWHVFSRVPFSWDPRTESLVHEPWKLKALEASCREGPPLRRWISL